MVNSESRFRVSRVPITREYQRVLSDSPVMSAAAETPTVQREMRNEMKYDRGICVEIIHVMDEETCSDSLINGEL